MSALPVSAVEVLPQVEPGQQSRAVPLSMLAKGERAVVQGMAEAGDAVQSGLRTRLLELGFVPGEAVRVVAESFPGRDPMAIRIGGTIFALRRSEAALIQVTPGTPHQ